MTTAIRKHLGDFLAIVVLVALALGVAGFILANERLRFPVIEEKPFKLKAALSDAQAVIPGQGQTVRVAGVRIGDLAKVDLKDGRAIVTMDIDPKYKHLVHTDATALLRPKTGVKDMFLELDPGSAHTPLMKEGSTISVSNTAPDIDPDEVLSALDTDTRDYLKLLIAGAGKGLDGHGGDLEAVLKRFLPLHRDLAKVTTAVAQRRHSLARLVHNYGSLTTELAKNDKDLTTLVTASNDVLSTFASQDQNISSLISKLPGTLRQATVTLPKVQTLGNELGPTFTELRPAVRALNTANRQVLPFVKAAAPAIKTKIRPFVRTARPYVRQLRPTVKNLNDATPDLTSSFEELNRFFNMASYNPGGRERLTGDINKDLNRDEGYLFWAGWLADLTNGIFSTSDASGPFRRSVLIVTCDTALQTLEAEVGGNLPSGLANLGLGTLAGFGDLLTTKGLCPNVAANG